jgi:hypothetical protein
MTVDPTIPEFTGDFTGEDSLPSGEVPKPLDPFYDYETLFEDELEDMQGELDEFDFYDG